jgi:hypothetical protein
MESWVYLVIMLVFIKIFVNKLRVLNACYRLKNNNYLYQDTDIKKKLSWIIRQNETCLKTFLKFIQSMLMMTMKIGKHQSKKIIIIYSIFNIIHHLFCTIFDKKSLKKYFPQFLLFRFLCKQVQLKVKH